MTTLSVPRFTTYEKEGPRTPLTLTPHVEGVSTGTIRDTKCRLPDVPPTLCSDTLEVTSTPPRRDPNPSNLGGPRGLSIIYLTYVKPPDTYSVAKLGLDIICPRTTVVVFSCDLLNSSLSLNDFPVTPYVSSRPFPPNALSLSSVFPLSATVW